MSELTKEASNAKNGSYAFITIVVVLTGALRRSYRLRASFRQEGFTESTMAEAKLRKETPFGLPQPRPSPQLRP